MAAPKKKPTTTKKTASKARKTTSTTRPKKTATRKVSPAKRKTTKKTKSSVNMKTLQVAKPERPFMSFQPGVQSVYWLLISTMVLALGSWVMYLHVEINNIYDTIELNDSLYYDNLMLDEVTRKKSSSDS